MSNEASPKCPQCGTPLPADAPKGLCPKCLMALNLETETAFTEDTLAAQPPLPPEQIAPHFPQLEILECLGRGGMGVVYKARQKTLNRFVALKLLAPERVRDAKFAERFTREAQALAVLNHPNIVTIYDFGQAGGFYYLLMEFVDGLNLRQLLRTRKFTPEEALAIVPPLCDALQFAHDQGIVHRDIKPENLLLDKAGRVKVADFGIAKMLGTGNGEKPGEPLAPESTTQSTVGTPGYSAPEQKTDPQRVDSRADIYSLGVVFYEMLTGELPGQKIAPPSTKVQIDVRLDEIVLRALEQKPELRYQQVSEVKTMVETITSDRGATKAKRNQPAKARLASWLTSPLSSSDVREITAHLTNAERSEFTVFGLLIGLWVVTVSFGSVWLFRSVPAPRNWMVASIIASLFLASLPLLWRMQRRLLCSTAWAKEHGYEAAHIKLFSFSRTNLGLLLSYAGLSILLIFGLNRLFPRLAGTAELTQSLQEGAARTKIQMARLAAQRNAAGTNLSFGPLMERTLRINGNECDFLVLHSGEILHHSYNDGDSDDITPATAFMSWARENEVDLGFCASTIPFYSSPGLLALDMGTHMFSETIPSNAIPRFASVAAWQAYNAAHPDSPAQSSLIGSLVGVTNVWNDLKADQFQGASNDVPGFFLAQKRVGLWFTPTNITGPIAFSTRDGVEGLLQITGFTRNPPEIKIRYKLVQNGNANTP